MVLGAGLGSRLKPFTEKYPKPLIPLLGVPCIDFSLMLLRDAGIKDIIVNVHAHADQMRSHLSHQTSISDESSRLLGSAGGFHKALSFFSNQPFISMNADAITVVDLPALTAKHQELSSRHGTLMTLVLAKGKALENQAGSYREIFTDEKSQKVVGFGEKKNRIPFYTGTAVFDPQCFTHLERDKPAEFVPEVLEPLIAQGKVGFTYSENLWMDIGSAELWHQSHFDLLHAYRAGELPSSWNEQIEIGLQRLKIDEDKQVVDYDCPIEITQRNYIRLKGIHYAISSLGN